MPAVEAMAAGIPLVSSDGGALSEVVADGGLVVPAGDSDALAATLERVLTDPHFARALGGQFAHSRWSHSTGLALTHADG